MKLLERLFFGGWFLFFAVFWSRLFFVNAQGDLVATHMNVWADWAAHFTMGSAMATRELFLTTSPLLLDAPFGYPFGTNLLSAILIRAGVPFFAAFVWPSFLFSLAMVGALFAFYAVLFRSRKVALVAATLFLLNGGWGFIHLFQDVKSSERPVHALLNPPRTYTHMPEARIHWRSVSDSMIIPQRAFTLGFPLALLLLLLAWPRIGARRMRNIGADRPCFFGRWGRSLGIGILWGLLPVIHIHSFFVVSGILFFWWVAEAVRDGPSRFLRTRLWACLVTILSAGVVALPFVWFFLLPHLEAAGGMMRWHPGWYARGHGIGGWLLLWMWSWGLLPLLALVGWCHFVRSGAWPGGPLQRAIQFAPFFLFFAAANLVLFQPYIWDNTKVFVWVSLGFCGLAGLFLRALFSAHAFRWRGKVLFPVWVSRTVAVLLFGTCILSGTIDGWRLLRPALSTHTMYHAEDLALADWARRETPPGSVWLTGPRHNHWLPNLTGRQAVMSYAGWLWSHGYDFRQTEADVRAMFRDPAGHGHLFDRYRVDFVVIDPSSRRAYGADPALFGPEFLAVQKTGRHTVLQRLS